MVSRVVIRGTAPAMSGIRHRDTNGSWTYMRTRPLDRQQFKYPVQNAPDRTQDTNEQVGVQFREVSDSVLYSSPWPPQGGHYELKSRRASRCRPAPGTVGRRVAKTRSFRTAQPPRRSS